MDVAARSRDSTNTRDLLLVLLDLAGDETAATIWAERMAPSAKVITIHKARLKGGTKLEALKQIRSLRPDVLAVFTTDAYLQNSRSAMMLFGVATGARTILMGDELGGLIARSRAGALFNESLRLLSELAIGYLVLVPVCWILTGVLYLWATFKEMEGAEGRKPAARRVSNRAHARTPEKRTAQSDPSTGPAPRILYLLAPPLTNHSGIPGGMGTHVTGFLGAVCALGGKVVMLTSVDPALPSGAVEVNVIRPSGAIGATKALFEIWNSLRFTIIAALTLARIKREPPAAYREIDFDFIYQRYNRFNGTGVALSFLSGLPLVLEYNGSEAWVAINWDPVGQRALLARLERLNQRAADLLVTISDVERKNLISARVNPKRIVTNPNGVDTEQFRPTCGGDELRKRLGIQDKVVVGFLGTFAPFHGPEVLARAAVQLEDSSDFHFLFIGDGDLRPAAEAIFARAGKSSVATFTGRIAHAWAPAHLDACDILVSPQVRAVDGTEFFGSPTKIFEYMAMARPVIASRLGQIASTVVDEVTGILVEPGNVHQLAEAIRRLKDDPKMRRRLGQAGRRRVCELYTWRRNASAVFDAVDCL